MKLGRPHYIGLLALGVSLLVAALCYARSRPRAALPTYNGKTVQEWFYGPTGHPGLQTTMNAARVAFNAMGTNCVPYLLDEVRRPETIRRKFYCWVYPKLPSLLTSKLTPPPLRPYYTQMIAL